MLPDIDGEVAFRELTRSDDDFQFSFDVKRVALGPHIAKKWGWDERFQRDFHRRRFAEKPMYKILLDNWAIGTVSVLFAEDHIRFGEFYLLPELQGRGLGTKILTHVLSLADTRHLPVRLEYLKWNPVGSLYLRHGFQVTQENDIHYFLERQPQGSSARS